MMFEKTKAKVDTVINDRVTQPIRLSFIISCSAFIIAGLALVVAVNRADR